MSDRADRSSVGKCAVRCESILVARALQALLGCSCALCFDAFRLFSNCRCGRSNPRTPAEPPCQTFRRHPCRRLPSGRHRTRKLGRCFCCSAPAARSTSTEKTTKPTSTDQGGPGVFRRGAVSREADGICGTEALGGAGAKPLRLQLQTQGL